MMSGAQEYAVAAPAAASFPASMATQSIGDTDSKRFRVLTEIDRPY